MQDAAAADVHELLIDARIRRSIGEEERLAQALSNPSPADKRRSSNSLRNSKTERAPLLQHDHEDQSGSLPNTAQNNGQAQDGWPGQAYLAGLPWQRRPSIFWLLPAFVLYTLAFGGVIVPKLNLILTLICRQYLSDRAVDVPTSAVMPIVFGADNPQCQIPEVQSLVARFTLYCSLFPGILTAVTSPKLGALSDRYGRTKMIAVTSIGMLVSEAFTVLAATWPESVSVWWLFLGYLLDGICGSFIAGIAVTHSYAADCTPPTRRNESFGYFHGALFAGIAAGPLIAGYIIKASGTVLSVFYIALIGHLIFFFWVLVIVPESLSPERQIAAREKYRVEKDGAPDWSITGMLKSANLFVPLDILFPTSDGANRATSMNLILLAAVDTIMFGVAMGAMTVVILYSEYMFGWGNVESSVFVSITNTCRVCVLVLVLPLINRIFRGRRRLLGQTRRSNSGSDPADLAIIRVSVFFDMMGYVGYAVARTGPLFILSGAIASFGAISSPTLQSSLTKHVPPDRIGQLLGAVGLLHALARVVAPTVFNLIYSATVGKSTQAVFVCLASTFGLAFLLSWFIKPYVSVDGVDNHNPGGLSGNDLAAESG